MEREYDVIECVSPLAYAIDGFTLIVTKTVKKGFKSIRSRRA